MPNTNFNPVTDFQAHIRMLKSGARAGAFPNDTVIYKTATNPGGAANTVVWTPAATKRVRLMAYRLQVPATTTLAAAAALTGQVVDNGTPIGPVEVFAVGTTVPLVGEDYDSGWVKVGGEFGILQAAVNTPLQYSISGVAFNAGTAQVTFAGWEEEG